MDLLQNPFHILRASTRDNRQKIMELADECSLLSDSGEYREARSELVNPRKRLSAEVAWLPGVGPKRVEEVLSLLAASPKELLNIDIVASIAKTNLLAAGLQRFSDLNAFDIAEWILEISWAFEEVELSRLCALINDERVVSGFPEVSDLSAIETEIHERRLHYRKVFKSSLDNLPSKELIEIVTLVVETATENGEEHGPILIADLVDSYEVDVQTFLEKEESNIRILIEKIRDAVRIGKTDVDLKVMVNKLVSVVKNWDSVAQPIQVSTKSRGLDHESSLRVAKEVRALSVELFNDHDKLEFTQQLTKMLEEVFAEVVTVAERVAEDVDVIDDIVENRAQLTDDLKKKDEQWRKEITYEVEVGAVFKDKLSISPEGIEWKGQNWDLESITRIRWGATKHSVNGIPTGTTYSIVFGNDKNIANIELRKESTYSNFIDHMWKAIGVRLLTEYLVGLRGGKKYGFGSAIISDLGIELERKKIFGSNEREFCQWKDVVIGNEAGNFCIWKKENKKFAASFSYQYQDNIHILESIIRMLWKRGGDRLSSALG